MSSRSSNVRCLSALFLGAALSLTAAACGGGAAAGGGAETGADGSLVGKAAPDFTAEAVGGEGPKSVKEANGKVVIVDFWGTFCGPCKKSFPKYQELVDQFGGDLAVIAVSVDEPDTEKSKLEEFIKTTGVKFSVVWNKDKSAAKSYGVETMPTAFVIDKTGVVKFIHAGYHDGEEDKLAEEIKGLIGN